MSAAVMIIILTIAIIALAYFVVDCRVRFNNLVRVVKIMDSALIEAHGWALQHNDEIPTRLAERLDSVEREVSEASQSQRDKDYLAWMISRARVEVMDAARGDLAKIIDSIRMGHASDFEAERGAEMLSKLKACELRKEDLADAPTLAVGPARDDYPAK
jgi:hypothetical protein